MIIYASDIFSRLESYFQCTFKQKADRTIMNHFSWVGGRIIVTKRISFVFD